MRAIAVVFLGRWAPGQVLNLYSQPQDPQMQINVMPWLTVAWALLLGRACHSRAQRRCCSRCCRWRRSPGILASSRAFAVATRAVAAVAALEQRFPPASTVFVYWGFEPITMWQYALWSRTWDWDGAVTIAPAP